MKEAYTISEFEWMLVEVHALWRRQEKTPTMKSKRIPFFCRHCNMDMVDKSELAWHRRQDLCPMYDAKKDEPLKMFPVNGGKGNKEIAAVFKKYNLRLSWQNGGSGGRRPRDKGHAEKREYEDVISLSSDDSQAKTASVDMKPRKKKLSKTMREELEDLQTEFRSGLKDKTGTRAGTEDKGKYQRRRVRGLSNGSSCTFFQGSDASGPSPGRTRSSTPEYIPFSWSLGAYSNVHSATLLKDGDSWADL